MFTVPLDAVLVHDWLTGKRNHTGVLPRTNATLLQQVYLHAQNSGRDPALQVELCVL